MCYIPNKTRKGTGSKRSHLLPGRYKAVITDVSQAEGYVPGEAFTVKYKLTVGDSTLVYKETFIDKPGEDRTVEFLDFLEDNGYDKEDLSTIIGLEAELELLKQKKGGGIFLNVYSRTYTGHQGDNA
jgi:hypothetical protein